jgi:malate dehydrogenase
MARKVTVVGAGNVGAQCACRLAQRDIAEVVLLDVVDGLPQGKGLDLSQAGYIDGYNSTILGTNLYEDTRDSAVVVITAGLARKPGMSRDDLVIKNAAITHEVIRNVFVHSPDSILIIVTNPLDVMTYYALKTSGLPAARVMGMAPLLDAARMAYFISQTLKIPLKDVCAEVLGSHGDLMVPLPRLSTAAGKPVTELMNPEQIAHIVDKTKNGGAEIVNLLKTGSAYYAPGSAAARMAASILEDKKEVISTCCYLNGQYGIADVCLGVPAQLGKNGIEEIIEIGLSPDELSALQSAAEAVKQLFPLLPV